MLIRIILNEVKDWVELIFVTNIPGRIGVVLRQIYWRLRLSKCISMSLGCGCRITGSRNISLGKNVNIMHNCNLYAHNNGRIVVGSRVSLNSNVQLGAADFGEIIIGDDVAIGPNVVIRASNHEYHDKNMPINKQGHIGGRITIEDDVWIGSNSVVLPNVVIHKGAVIGAGAVVNRDVPSFALAVGVPARVIKENCRE